MSKRHRRMIVRAQRRFGRIFPCGDRPVLSMCYTEQNSRLLFWFNTSDGSTHVEVQSLLHPCRDGADR